MTDNRTAEKLAELCDGDRRSTNPSTRAVATAITTPGPDNPMPDPHGDRARQQQFLGYARAILQQQPTARSVRSAGHRLIVSLSNLTEQMAKEAGDERHGN